MVLVEGLVEQGWQTDGYSSFFLGFLALMR
jgi:hypothetical protein